MRKKPLFQTFIGIDQTGAILPGSHGARTRPLAWAIVHLRDKRLHLQIPDKRLKAFDLQEIEKSAGDTGYTATLVDCVLGLPHEGPPWSLAMRRISRLPPIFGRRPAEVFFSSLLDPARTIPSRLCEEIAQANSVFRSRPFQKNIQTGTFRIWMDMSRDPRKAEWLIWPFTQNQGQFTLFEGYPSLLWRTLAQQKTRAPEKLAAWLRSQAVQFQT
ncbi:hypothetical protein EBZ37_10185, partial [bacterium]|nr:hypothetical protein [bacterium]